MSSHINIGTHTKCPYLYTHKTYTHYMHLNKCSCAHSAYNDMYIDKQIDNMDEMMMKLNYNNIA